MAFTRPDREPAYSGLRPMPVMSAGDIASTAVQGLLATALLLFLLPLLLVVGLLIFVEDGGPVIFIQHRVGRGGRAFPCVKLRTMRMGAESELEAILARDPAARMEWAATQKLQVDPRVTRIGLVLRRLSLDEVPQLINVLLGHMNIVGPRPIVPAEIPRYGRRFSAYCSTRPGLTGLWQVSGRSDVSYRSRVALDVLYAKSRSPIFDLKILLVTVKIVLGRRGSY